MRDDSFDAIYYGIRGDVLDKEFIKNLYARKTNKVEVIFNDPMTILNINGKKYTSKAHDEPFDKEKGLLMCLAKANGISHLELQRMIKNAKVQQPKEKVKKNKENE